MVLLTFLSFECHYHLNVITGERGGVVVEHRTPNREVLSSILIGGTVLCPCARHMFVFIVLPTVLVKPRKRWLCPDMTEKLLTETFSLNTNKQTNNKCHYENMSM